MWPGACCVTPASRPARLRAVFAESYRYRLPGGSVKAQTGIARAAGDLPLAAQHRNIVGFIADSVLFSMAAAILNPSVMPPDFVTRLGGGPVLAGFAGLIFRAFWLVPQVFFAAWINRVPRKKRFIVLPAIPGRAFLLVVAGLMIAAGPDRPGVLIALLLLGLATFGFCDGISSVAWTDVLGSSMTATQRSWMISLSQVLGGILVALVVTPLVRHVLGPAGPVFPGNYGLLLAISSLLLLGGLSAYVLVREGHSPPPPDSPSLRQYRTFLWRSLREDRGFRYYLLTRFFYDLSMAGLPFYIVFATEVLGQASAVALSDQILLTTVTGIAAALLLGRINYRYGPRRVMVLAGVAAFSGPLLVLSARILGVTGLHLAWITVGVVNSAFMQGFLNWVVEYAPDGYRPIYSGLANTLGLVALSAPLFGGLIVQVASFDVLFAAASGLGVLAVALILRLPDPRREAVREAV